MLANLKVPGVYVQEITTLPPSVAAVETAIPAFLGYTQFTTNTAGDTLVDQPIRIGSQLEYEAIFGFGPPAAVSTVTLDASGAFVSSDLEVRYYLYDAIRLFYANGGGDCYVVSTGGYTFTGTGDAEILDTDFTDAGRALEAIAKVDEPTLLLFPDMAATDATALTDVQKAALLQCGDLQDRFTICDLIRADTTARTGPPSEAPGQNFRDAIGVNQLSYGAVYTPWLRTNLLHPVDYGLLENIDIVLADGSTLSGFDHTSLHNDDPDILAFMRIGRIGAAHRDIQTNTPADAGDLTTALDDFEAAPPVTPLPPEVTAARPDLDTAIAAYDPTDANTLTDLSDAFDAYHAVLVTAFDPDANLRRIFPTYGTVANGIETDITFHPPSGAVAGVYARVDAARGVWKAPANESILRVLGPEVRYTQSQLENLNVHTTGKSINAIRAFPGKGTLIFGARTLAGNDGEYKYINVRRLLIFLEESIKKASEAFVFEPNDANTWLRVRGMIENFLNLQWRAGALQGARAEDAYRVAIGLGQTMSADDVTNGRMIVEISLAPVRPAEFIILRFSQQQAQS
ncbi:phage tail sheath C-terminal domain-containing protein [Lewinella sp. JB7]|uniref:phage tail sheath family protein n=1 Tax=Lewinella sp. JB7 TaxID=2962887 RepID=UPI0020C9A23B|nr:phage tail sheath C-terminal domain-containing protein [Lewinella sp. JB7]MCP9234662.1 phage tail sheath subtilisin-like domain-containing protein [Lewinella sp. JB7]